MSDRNGDIETELARDIGYALSRLTFKVKGQPIEALRIVAADVVRHLLLANGRFGRRPPTPPHSAGDRK